MLRFKLELFLFEHTNPINLPITEEIALSLVGAWEMYEDSNHRGVFEAAKEEAKTKQAKRTARDRLYENTCIEVEWEEK